MTSNKTFRRVETFSDDAITIRVTRIDGKFIGMVDFPSFQRNGKLIQSNGIAPRPLNEALAVAEKILPHTPFPEIVILARPELCQHV
jgi:hypothetical protein